jgi:SAM-dependent methyltransferase
MIAGCGERTMIAARSGAAVQAGGRHDAYYQQARPEVAALVPVGCRRVLDVGCGAGALGRSLKTLGHEVTGVELVPAAAEVARRWLDHVEVFDIEAQAWPFRANAFDAIVFADILEHLLDPWRVLREATTFLTDGGYVIASVPNVQNWDVLRRLAFGHWSYRNRGILDSGHLRFFTRQSIRELFEQAGLRPTRIVPHYRRSWPRAMARILTAGRAESYLARQYLVAGVLESRPQE